MIPSGLPNWFVIHIIRLNHPDLLQNTTSKLCRSQQLLHGDLSTTHLMEESGLRGKANWFMHFPQQLALHFSIKADFMVDATSDGCHPCKKIAVQTHYSKRLQRGVCRTLAEHRLCLSRPSTWSWVTQSPGDSAESCLSRLFQQALIALTAM